MHILAAGLVAVGGFGEFRAHGRDNYRSEREMASQSVTAKERKEQARREMQKSEAGLAPPASALDFAHNPLKLGETWRVAANLSQAKQARKSELHPHNNERDNTHTDSVVIIRFEVIRVEPEVATLKITRPESLDLIVRMDQKRRATLSPGSHLQGLDGFPLVIPSFDAVSAQTKSLDNVPLPAGLKKFDAQRIKGPGIAFTGEDSFSRPIEVIWRKGDPWPAYMSGPAGTAVLLMEGP